MSHCDIENLDSRQGAKTLEIQIFCFAGLAALRENFLLNHSLSGGKWFFSLKIRDEWGGLGMSAGVLFGKLDK